MDNLHLKIDPLQGNTLTVLAGEALKQKEPNVIKISGDIKSVRSFLEGRLKKDGVKVTVTQDQNFGLQGVDISRAIILINKEALTIKLAVDPENFYGPIVSGELKEAEELKAFSINQNKTFRKEELVKLLKFNKIFFDDHAKHAELVLAFQKVSSVVNVRANDSSDERGNKEIAFVKEVTTNAPTEFILNIPVFKGFKPERFRVEICLDVTEGSARFWFESVELHELKQKRVDEIFETELKTFGGMVMINE